MLLLEPNYLEEVRKKLKSNVEQEVFISLNKEAVPEVKEIILRNYENLSLYRMHRDSDLKLYRFYNTLKDLLDNYLFLNVNSNKIKFKVPNIQDIQESDIDEMKVLLVIMEGLVGSYLELNQEDIRILNIPINNAIEFIIDSKKVYLIRRTTELESALSARGLEVKPWPFSKPEDIFSDADYLVGNNMDSWIKESINNARKKLIQEYK